MFEVPIGLYEWKMTTAHPILTIMFENVLKTFEAEIFKILLNILKTFLNKKSVLLGSESI